MRSQVDRGDVLFALGGRTRVFVLGAALACTIPSHAAASGMTECKLQPMMPDCTVWPPAPLSKGGAAFGWPWPESAPLQLWIACRDTGSAPGGPGWRTPWRLPRSGWQVHVLPHRRRIDAAGWRRVRREEEWVIILRDGSTAQPATVNTATAARCLGVPLQALSALGRGTYDIALTSQEGRAEITIATRAELSDRTRVELQADGRLPDPAPPAPATHKPGGGCASCAASPSVAFDSRWLIGLLLVGAALCRRRGVRSQPRLTSGRDRAGPPACPASSRARRRCSSRRASPATAPDWTDPGRPATPGTGPSRARISRTTRSRRR